MSTFSITWTDRGETLRYRVPGRSLVAGVTGAGGWTLHTWSARRWDAPDAAAVPDAEFAVAVARMVAYLEGAGCQGVSVNEGPPESTRDR